MAKALGWLFGSYRFAILTVFVVFFYELFLVAMLLAPESDGAFGSFARDFKVWCFGFDDATGSVRLMYVLMMVTEPVALVATTLFVWWRPVKQLLRQSPRLLWPWAGAAFAMMAVAALGLGAIGLGKPAPQELPFPAERLRTAHVPPRLDLIDQTGETVSLEALRGRVVVLTAVYASCGLTCPMILGQAKRAVAGLSEAERAGLSVIGVTLDPEHDTPQALAEMARVQNVSAPRFRLVTGEPARVSSVLDEMGIARERDPKTGVISHANVFLVIDRSGKLAYRFSLGGQQERWLTKALQVLLREAAPVG